MSHIPPRKRPELRQSDTATDNSSDDDDVEEDDPNSVQEMSQTSEDDEPPHPSFKRAATSFYSNSQSDDNEQSSDEQSLMKKPCTTQSTTNPNGYTEGVFSNKKVAKMLEGMGHKIGKGLGKDEQGRVDPIPMSTQKGRRGLGMVLKDLNSAAELWTSEMVEVVELKEPYQWLINDQDDLNDLTRDVLDSWIVVGERKMTIDDETKFVDPGILERVLTSKSAFDQEEALDMLKARTRSNPFETIGRSIFLNRAAVKMANIDAMFNEMFTNPVDENDDPLVRDKDLLYFADVCAGPGGFSEYVLYRKKWLAKGFGFTLKASNDFKLDEFKAGSPESFDPFYGERNDGDIFVPENIESFQKYVLQQTEAGVFFMMADGGFSVENQYNIQEILSKQLYLCQFIVALAIVREKGHFVCKLFDLFTPFSVGLVYLMYKCFQQITIIKPNTSRPANSERYIVCKWKKPNTDTIYRHLFDINKEMYTNSDSPVDTLELVPYDVIQNDSRFFDYIYNSNNQIGQNQIVGLIKIAAFCRDSNLLEPRQNEIKEQCLKLWKLPDAMRVDKQVKPPDQHCDELLKQWSTEKDFFTIEEKTIKGKRHLRKEFNDIHDWKFVAIEITENVDKTVRTLFMGQGGADTLIYKPEQGGHWDSAPIRIELSPNTLIYGEIVKELIGEHRKQTIVYSFHIIDAICLGGIDVRSLPLQKRNEMCQKFAKSLNKPRGTSNQPRGTPIRCKILYRLPDMEAFFDRLTHIKLKDGKKRYALRLRNDFEDDRYFAPRGLLFFKETKMALSKAFSKSNQRHYYYDAVKRHAFYPETLADPNQIYASFRGTFMDRRLWPWELETQVDETYANTDEESTMLYRTDLMSFINEKEQA